MRYIPKEYWSLWVPIVSACVAGCCVTPEVVEEIVAEVTTPTDTEALGRSLRLSQPVFQQWNSGVEEEKI